MDETLLVFCIISIISYFVIFFYIIYNHKYGSEEQYGNNATGENLSIFFIIVIFITILLDIIFKLPQYLF